MEEGSEHVPHSSQSCLTPQNATEDEIRLANRRKALQIARQELALAKEEAALERERNEFQESLRYLELQRERADEDITARANGEWPRGLRQQEAWEEAHPEYAIPNTQKTD